MSANLLAGSNGALDTLGNGTGSANGTVNGVKTEPIDRMQHDVEIEEDADDTPEVDIHISNVVCNFSTRCHLNLRQIATNGMNVEYRREQGVVSMKIRKPMVTASIWSSGKITCTGATSETEAKTAARKVARTLQKMSFKVKFTSYRVVNVLGSVILPFGIKIAQFTEQHRQICSYEPELHPGATYRFKEAGATLKIFQTGAITITAPSVQKVQMAVEHIYPLVYLYKKDKPVPLVLSRKRAVLDPHNSPNGTTISPYRSELNGKRRKVFDGAMEEDEEEDEMFISAHVWNRDDNY